MQKKKGFTLIELLVVIAIIGILAAIVLVSVRTGPQRAKDARIISAMAQARTTAVEIYAENNSDYSSLCDTTDNSFNDDNYSGSADIKDSLTAIEDDIEGNMPTGGSIACYASTDSYCVTAPLNKTGKHYCIDTTKAKEVSNPCSAGKTCDDL